MSDLDEKIGRILAIVEATQEDVRQLRNCDAQQNKDLESLRIEQASNRIYLRIGLGILGVTVLGGGSAAATLLKLFG